MTQNINKEKHTIMTGNKCAGGFFEDLHKPLNDLAAIKEADHCLYCYDAPCIRACPTSIDIPTFIHQIKTGNIAGSARTILGENIMGGTCARVCPTEILCEGACVHNGTHNGQNSCDEPVKIGLLQRYATDYLMMSDAPHPFARAPESGKYIAIVGAGPAGLACAHRAAMQGHNVTVYEAKAKAGGLNEYGLAAYKMIDDFAAREVTFLLGIGGIEIKYGTPFGTGISLDKLRQDHDAVFIAIGLGGTNNLDLAGEDMGGISDAIDFIETIRQSDDPAALDPGRNILVIGGGNTAIDAAVQAKKLGSRTVTLAYRRGEQQMGATGYELDLARRSGVIVNLWSKPVALQGGDTITSVTFEQTRLKDGKLVGTGETYDIVCDGLLKAIGQKLGEQKLGEPELNGLVIKHGKLAISDDYQTNVPGVFAGGDCVATGEDLTVQAVQDGKQAAIAMDAWLKTN